MKAVRWEIPFVSIDDVHYCIKIYKEFDNTWSTPTVLDAGSTPFVTDEDGSDDVFYPVRAQSGTIQVCTKIPAGGMLKLEDILPSNNIEYFVKLVSISGNTEKTEWIGFLSCEAYSQEYIGIPQILDLPVISVLEAMDSIPMNQTRTHGMKKISDVVYDVFMTIENASGFACYNYINYSAESYRIFEKYIDTSILFQQDKVDNTNNSEYVVNGISCKEVLSKICTFMGWIVRENSDEIYFQRIKESTGMYKESISDFGNSFHTEADFLYDLQHAIDYLEWRGDNHKISITQGAQSVKVVAKVDKNDFDFDLPGFPEGDMSPEKYVFFADNTTDGHNTPKMYTYFSYEPYAYSNIEFTGGYACTMVWSNNNTNVTSQYAGTQTRDQSKQESYLWGYQTAVFRTAKSAGAFFIMHTDRSDSLPNEPFKSGMYCCFLPQLYGIDIPIFKMWTPKSYCFQQGKLYLNINFSRIIGLDFRPSDQRGDDHPNRLLFADDKGEFSKVLYVAVSVGDKYSDGLGGWSDTKQTIDINFWGKTADYDIEIPSYMEGKVKVEIMGYSWGQGGFLFYDGIIDEITLTYESKKGDIENDRTENHYFQLLHTNFRDNIAIESDLASNMNNHPSPSVIMDTSSTPMTTLNYGTEQTPDMRRPEVDLLNRLAAYYGAARKKLELEIKHLIGYPLARTTLIQIVGGKRYLPLSESRDWQTDVCKLQCFELPQ